MQGEEDRYGIEPEAAYYAAPRDHSPDPKPSKLGGDQSPSRTSRKARVWLTGFGTFFLYLLGVVAIAGCVWVGIVMLQKRQEQSRKRFY